MTARPRLLALLLLPLSLAVTSCGDDLGPKGAPVRLEIRAEVAGLASAGTLNVGVAVGYQVAGGGTRPLETNPSGFQVTTGGPSTSPPITVFLSPCLNDAERVSAETSGCRLVVTLTLSDDRGDLAQATQDLGVVQEGEQKSAETISLTPNYQLDIAGEGTGSGTIAVAAVGAQPALSCQITDGQAGTEGCGARYPLHTAVVLTAGGGTLASWGGDCGATPAGSPCALTMDGHRAAAATFVAVPTTGELEIQIAGLPPGNPAQVTVSTTGGFSQAVTESTVLSGLLPGSYTVTAQPVAVAAEGTTYTAEPAEQSVSVSVGQRTTVQIGYNPPETGSLAVAITGVPQGSAAAVTVTGPSGFNQALTTGQTLSGLVPGSYTVTARDVETADQVYAPSPASQTRTVAATQTAEATVTYTASRVSLTVTITGLPAGLPAKVTVAGPGGYQQVLATTTQLIKLQAGNYTVTAENVTATDEQVYESTVTPRQPVLIRSGSSAEVTVAYGVPAAAKLVFVQQPTTATIDSVIKPAITVAVRDRLDHTVPGYTSPVTLQLHGNGAATLGGTATVVPENGVATFGDLTVNELGSRYTLVASSGSLAPATSDAFEITGGTPIITFVEFPDTVSNGPGATVEASIGFADPARDIADVLVREIADPNEVYTPRDLAVTVPAPGTDVIGVGLWTCAASSGCRVGPVTLELRLRDSEGNVSDPRVVSFNVAGDAPTITNITFPDEIPGTPNTFTRGRIDFTDPDGDIVLVDEAVVRCVHLNCNPDDFNPNASGRTQGSLSFNWGCIGPGSCAGAEVTLRFVLQDFAGNRSNAVDVSFTFVSGTITVINARALPRAGPPPRK